MKRILLVTAAIVGTVLATAVLALGESRQRGAFNTVVVRNNQFDPDRVPSETVTQGAIEIRWFGDTGGPHSVRQDDRLFSSGAPDSPFGTFDQDISAGSYHYYCTVHGSPRGGMDGVVRVRPSPEPGDGDSALVFWADPAAEARHRFTVQFRRKAASARRWKTWKAASKRISGDFGARNVPINARPGITYEVRARTFVKGARDRRSGFSPREPLMVD